MRHLFVIDPIERLDPEKDTTIAFLREADRRGHELAVCTIDTLELGPDGRPKAEAIPTRTVAPTANGAWYEVGTGQTAFLDEFDVVWMRKDPPFDMSFFYATHLLSMVAKSTLVVNDPLALRDANEKLFALRFPAVCPPARVSADAFRKLLAVPAGDGRRNDRQAARRRRRRGRLSPARPATGTRAPSWRRPPRTRAATSWRSATCRRFGTATSG